MVLLMPHRWLVLVGLAFVLLGVRTLSRRWLFPVTELQLPGLAVSRSAGGESAANSTVGAERRAFGARDGTVVHALELVAPEGGRTIVDFHNNRETIENRLDVARALRAYGFGVLLVEYRGYGSSRGQAPSEEGLYLDAEAALDMLATRGIPAERIVLWGTSLGTGVAAEMARRGRGARLILVSPYTSIPDLVTDVVPGIPARILVADHFDTLAKAGEIRVPTTVVHGDADEIVPFWMGQRIARAIPGAHLVRVLGGHHGDLFERDRERLLTELVGAGI